MGDDVSSFETELESGRRFAFGRNWNAFLGSVTESTVQQAVDSLRHMLEVDDLVGKRFVDMGSGSGLFSLAAYRMGAQVLSFDFDPQSVECTRVVRERSGADRSRWDIVQASVLDQEFLRSIGRWDVVYSWGVLHHTGDMWTAIDNAASAVAPGGSLFIAIYNDQGAGSRRWWHVKRTYNRLPPALRWMVLAPAAVRIWGPTMVRDLLTGHPLRTWKDYSQESNRGMSPWRDVIDWVGGFPFEVARPDAVVEHCEQLGFECARVVDRRPGIGCNEFVFVSEVSAR